MLGYDTIQKRRVGSMLAKLEIRSSPHGIQKYASQKELHVTGRLTGSMSFANRDSAETASTIPQSRRRESRSTKKALKA